MASTAAKTYYCSFCGKDDTTVQKLIAGPDVFICNECVIVCMEIVERPDGAAPTNEDR